MKIKRIYLFLLFSLILILFSFKALSHEEGDNLPEGLHKIIEYNKQQANFYLKNLSFVVAFLAGILSVLTPCSLAIMPAFFAYTFKERKRITKMTLAFFLGFMPVFIILGLVATFLGQSIATLQQNNRFIVIIAGSFILFLGLMTLLGKGFTFIKVKSKIKRNFLGIFLYGLVFGIGWTACMGPILVGILLIASISQNYLYSTFLLLFYSLGLFVPLFLISFLFDKYNLSENKWIKGKIIKFNIFNKKIEIHTTNLIAGILLLFVGLLFVIYGGTSIINTLGFGDFTSYVYSLQDKLVLLRFSNIVGTIVLLIFLFLLWRFLKRKK